jgi:hypothetical protein
MPKKNPVTNCEYVQMETKEDPPGHLKLCGELQSFPMVQTILGDESWNYNFDEMLHTAELTITPKTNDKPRCSLQLLKMAIIHLFQDDDFTIMPNSMYVINGTEKLMMYKEITK